MSKKHQQRNHNLFDDPAPAAPVVEPEPPPPAPEPVAPEPPAYASSSTEPFDAGLMATVFREEARAAELAPVLPVPVVVPSPAPPLPPPPPPPPATRGANSAMHQTALVFLDDPLARKLAVAWSSCSGQFESDADWIQAAGISQTNDATRLCKALKINGICRPGGVTDGLALQYIARILAAPLLSKEGKGKR